MGADESKLQPGQLRSQRDEDIPYTSYSISKPIDGDNPKPSAITRPRPRNRSPQPPNRAGDPGSRLSDPGSGGQGRAHDIVVVAEGNTEEDEDSELKKLENVAVFLPLMRASLNLPSGSSQRTEEVLEKLDCDQLMLLCHRYQEHLRQCGEAVAFDQNALCVRIKEVDISIHTIYSHLTERQRKFAKYAEQIQKVNEMSTVLNKVRMNIAEVVPLMDRLNSVLPPEHQLEPFVMKLK